MGGGTKEKASRQAESSQLSAELAGVKSLVFFIFLAFIAFCMRFSLSLAAGMEPAAEGAQLMAKLARDSAQRKERWAKRDLALLAGDISMSETERLQQAEIKQRQMQLDTEIPEWASPRSASRQLQRKKPAFDVEFEESEKLGEEAEREIRLQVGEWLTEIDLAQKSKQQQQKVATASEAYLKLKKRQEFVDSVLDGVMDIPDLEFDLSVFTLESDSVAGAETSKD